MNNIKDKIDETKKNLRDKLANDEFNVRWKDGKNKKIHLKQPKIKEFSVNSPTQNISSQNNPQVKNPAETRFPQSMPSNQTAKQIPSETKSDNLKTGTAQILNQTVKQIPQIQTQKPVQISPPNLSTGSPLSAGSVAKQMVINQSSSNAFSTSSEDNKTQISSKPEVKINSVSQKTNSQPLPEEIKKHNLETKSSDKNLPMVKLASLPVASEVKTMPIDKDSKLIESYKVKSGSAEIEVNIRKEKLGMKYYLEVPKVDIATLVLLGEVRNELVSISNVNMKELIDPDAFEGIKVKFTDDAIKVIKKKLPNVDKDTQDFLVEHLIQDMLGLGKIEFMINDPYLEEIVIVSSKEAIRVFNKKHGWLETNIVVEKEEEIINYSNIIARRVGRQINVLNPLLDAHLVTGDRINAVLYPINTKGSTITIRKFARDPYTIVDLIGNKTCDSEVAALIWLAMEYEMNILISGGTASGKTVFLNSCLPFIPPNQRILSIEDTRELMLPEFLYWTPLVTRTPNPEGKGEVSMLDLLVNSLRMRPDRIILGEMRKQEEAMVLFEAMHTGHSVYATLHADSASETISRLINPPLSVPANLLKSVNLNVVMFRDRRRGIRRISQIAEIEAENGTAKANILYRWIPEEDRIVKHAASSRLYEDLGRHTGMSEAQIDLDLKRRKEILLWLVKNKIRDLESFGKVINLYYRNREILDEAMKTDNLKVLEL